MTAGISRGLHSNNPGNIRRDGTKWQGMAEDQSGDAEFVVFDAPKWGIRAIARIIISYHDKYELNTIRGIIHRWAPPSENDTDAYVMDVATRVGVGADNTLDVTKYGVMRPLVEAIIHHENGSQPYGKDVLDAGLKLAGIEPPKKPISKEGTVLSQAATATGMAGAAGTDKIQAIADTATQLQPLVDYSTYIKMAFLGLSVLGIVMTLYFKVRERRV